MSHICISIQPRTHLPLFPLLPVDYVLLSHQQTGPISSLSQAIEGVFVFFFFTKRSSSLLSDASKSCASQHLVTVVVSHISLSPGHMEGLVSSNTRANKQPFEVQQRKSL